MPVVVRFRVVCSGFDNVTGACYTVVIMLGEYLIYRFGKRRGRKGSERSASSAFREMRERAEGCCRHCGWCGDHPFYEMCDICDADFFD